MTRLPPKRLRPRSGIARAPKREWPRHRRFVKSHHCVVPGCEAGPIEFAHIRSAANSGTGLKPSDADGVPFCIDHHAEQHRIGQKAFEQKHGIDLFALAAEFARRSPDLKMKESMSHAQRAS